METNIIAAEDIFVPSLACLTEEKKTTQEKVSHVQVELSRILAAIFYQNIKILA